MYLSNYHCYLARHPSSTPSSPSSNYVKYPISSFLSYKKLSPSFRSFVLAITCQTEPQSFSQAIEFHIWRDVMATELRALTNNKTWSICSLPPGKHPVRCKWVYKTKFKVDGIVKRHKAWLVAKGFSQQEGIDFLDTFSLVAKLVTVKVRLALATVYGWSLYNLMSLMHFFMVTSMKKFTWEFFLDILLARGSFCLLMLFVDCTNPYMV